MNQNIKQMYSVSEAIEATGLGKTSLYGEIRDGNIVAKKFGNRTLIPVQEIEKWLNNLPAKSKVGGVE